MVVQQAHWNKTLLWGGITGVLYALLFYFGADILMLAQTTPDACQVASAEGMRFLHQIDAGQCATQGGAFIEGHWWNALLPIAYALILSYAHGAFTGHFWESMGLKAAGGAH